MLVQKAIRELLGHLGLKDLKDNKEPLVLLAQQDLLVHPGPEDNQVHVEILDQKEPLD